MILRRHRISCVGRRIRPARGLPFRRTGAIILFGMANKVGEGNELNAARLAQAFSHPIRFRILQLLRDEGAYVMHLTSMLGRPQANISQHLAILRDAGLVTDEREGMTVVYKVRDGRVFDLMDRLSALGGSASGISEGERTGVPWHPGEGPPMGRMGPGRGGHCHCPRCTGR